MTHYIFRPVFSRIFRLASTVAQSVSGSGEIVAKSASCLPKETGSRRAFPPALVLLCLLALDASAELPQRFSPAFTAAGELPTQLIRGGDSVAEPPGGHLAAVSRQSVQPADCPASSSSPSSACMHGEHRAATAALLPESLVAVATGRRNPEDDSSADKEAKRQTGVAKKLSAEAPRKSHHRIDAVSCIAADPDVHYGFPRMVRAGNGDLLLFYRVGTTHAYDDSRIAMRRSTNNGQDWNDERILWKADPGLSAHNPVALVCPSGKVILWASAFRYSTKPPARLPGYWAHSTDHGKTWSPFVRFDKDPGRSLYYVTEAIVVSDGLLAAGSAFPPSGVGKCWTLILHSDDGGGHWSVRSRLTTIEENKGDEVALVETEPGVLLCLLRDRQGRETFRLWSHDGGRSWSPRTSIRGQIDCTCTLQRPFLTQLDEDTLVLSGRDRNRKQVVAYVSRDAGDAFTRYCVLDTYQKDGGYTTAVPLDKTTVFMAWYSDSGTTPLKPDIKSTRLHVRRNAK